MNLKNIVLYRAAVDNAGNFRDAGSTLAVADGNDPDTIDAERAQELLDSMGAVSATAAAQQEAAPAPKTDPSQDGETK